MIRCANPVSPEGGPRDVIPPRLKEADPPLGTTHFNAGSVKLTFDEFIILKDISKQIIISPPTLPKTDFRLKGKTLVVDFSDPLLPNTTYSINFGTAIQDLTENNILNNFRYVFSTGDFIDSLQMKGRIVDAFNLSPRKDVLAMIYINNNDTVPFDSLPYRVKPYYIDRTDETGEFSFTNLSDKPMLLFALEDKNGNSIYDMPNESIAFVDTLIHAYYLPPADTTRPDSVKADTAKADTSKKNQPVPIKTSYEGNPYYTMRMFLEEDTVQRRLKTEIRQPGQLAAYYRHPVTNPQVMSLDKSDTVPVLSEFSPNNDSLYIWLTKHQDDTLRYIITANGLAIDTVTFAPAVEKKRNEKVVPKLGVSSNLRDGTLNFFRNYPLLTVSYPVVRADLSRIRILFEKDTVAAEASFADSVHRKIRVNYKWKEATRYRIIIPDSTLFSATGLTNDSIVSSFTTRASRDLGSLAINLSSSSSSPNFIIQLLTEKENIIEERNTATLSKMVFANLSPGKYRLKVIFDQNNNHKWDTGDYLKRIQPESVSFYPGVIDVRANWDVEEKWDF